MHVLARRTLLSLLFVAAIGATLSGCSGSDGGSSPAAPQPRYLDVTGRWTGTWWAADGLVPSGITMDVGQNGASVNGTIFMTIGTETFVISGPMGTVGVDNAGSGSFAFRSSDSSGSFSAQMSVSRGEMTGYATLAAGGDSIGGQMTLHRIGNTPAGLTAASGASKMDEIARVLIRKAPLD